MLVVPCDSIRQGARKHDAGRTGHRHKNHRLSIDKSILMPDPISPPHLFPLLCNDSLSFLHQRIEGQAEVTPSPFPQKTEKVKPHGVEKIRGGAKTGGGVAPVFEN